jgi:hypothetical protein
MKKLLIALAASLVAVSSYAQSTDDFDFETTPMAPSLVSTSALML